MLFFAILFMHCIESNTIPYKLENSKKMRLTALARKIHKTPSELIAILADYGIKPENGINSKITDEIANSILADFDVAPTDSDPVDLPEDNTPKTDQISEVADDTMDEASPVKQEENPEESEAEEVTEENVKKNVAEQEQPTEEEKEEEKSEGGKLIGTIEDLESDRAQSIELIKAKKIKLEGIKVVGKIELPEKKEKSPKDALELEENEQAKTAEVKPPPRKRKPNKKKRQKHGELSYEERVKEEAREKLKLKRRRENEARRRKKKYYETEVKPKYVPKQPSRKKRKKHIEADTYQAPVVVHKNPLKRLWAWLNGKYDRY